MRRRGSSCTAKKKITHHLVSSAHTRSKQMQLSRATCFVFVLRLPSAVAQLQV